MTHTPLTTQNKSVSTQAVPFAHTIGRSPLLIQANQLIKTLHRLEMLYPHYGHTELQHELFALLKTFQSNLQRHGVNQAMMIASTHLLCDWSEQIIQHTKWGNDTQTKALRTMLNLPQKQNNPIQSYLATCFAKAHTHIDFLELYYLALRLGYIPSDPTCDIDEVHACIQHTVATLDKTPRQTIDTAQEKTQKKAPWDLVFFSLITCLGLYASLQFSLEKTTTEVATLLHILP